MKRLQNNLLACAVMLGAALSPQTVLAQDTGEQQKPTFCLDLTFVARGESNVVETVKVENLTAGTQKMLSGSDILRLTDLETAIRTVEADRQGEFAIQDGKVTFTPTQSGSATVMVYGLNGLLVLSRSMTTQAGEPCEFALPSMMAKGIYIVRVKAPGIDRSVKMANNGSNINWSRRPLFAAEAIEEAAATNTSRTRVAQLLTPESEKNYVEMLYTPGDVLRFTGKSGKMRTIVTNVPTLSHDITFDFFDCTDATGYTYAIVNAGGMLWMAEDLHYNAQVPLMKSEDEFKAYDCTQPMASFADFTEGGADDVCYYNYAGAKAALPEGWELPTQEQMRYVGGLLGGMDVAGEMMKSRGTGDWQTSVEGADQVSIGFRPSGYMTAEGELSYVNNRAIYMTRSTKDLKPYLFEMHDGDKELKVGDAYSCKNFRWAYPVRGCRQAPSAYTSMIDAFGLNLGFNAPARQDDPETLYPGMVSRAPSSAPAKSPAGDLYTLRNEMDYYMSNRTIQYAPQTYSPDWPSWKDWNETVLNLNNSSVLFTNWSDPNNERCIRKMVTQRTADGHTTPILVYFDKQFTYKHAMVNETNGDGRKSVAGTGRIWLEHYNDARSDFNGGAIRCIGDFTNAEVETYDRVDFRRSDYSGYWMNYYTSRYLYEWMEVNSRALSVATGDLTGDLNDDILVSMGNKVVLVDGATYKTIGEATGLPWGPHKTFLLEDINEDGYIDIVYICPGGGTDDVATLAIFFGSEEQNAWDSFQNDPKHPDIEKYLEGGRFFDVKFGDVVGNGKKQLVAYTSPRLNDLDYTESNFTRIFVYNITPDEKNIEIIGNATGGTVSAGSSEFTHFRGIELVAFRGPGFPKDIVATNKILRFNPESKKFEDQGTQLCHFWREYKNSEDKDDSDTKSGRLKYAYIPTASVSVGDFDCDGREEIAFMGVQAHLTYNNDNWRRVHSAAQIIYLKYHPEKQNTGDANQIWTYSFPKGKTDICYHVLKGSGGKYSNWGEAICSWPYATTVARTPYSMMRYTGDHQVLMSEPRIYALLAAPPYYNAYKDDYPDATGTAWGRSSTTGQSTSTSSSNAASVIFGFEQDITLIFTKIGGIDFETSLTSEWTKSSESTQTIGYSREYKTLWDDAVVMTYTPYDTYTYEVVASPFPDGVGQLFTISNPRTPYTMCVTLDDYTRLRADNPEIPDLRKLFCHTVGKPSTYAHTTRFFPGNTLWGNGSADQMEATGSGSTTTLGIDLDKEKSQSSEFTFEVETQLVSTIGKVKIGGGYKHGETKGTTHTEGEGFSISAEVISPQSIYDLTPFKWNVGWYKATLGGQTFPVVNYITVGNWGEGE